MTKVINLGAVNILGNLGCWPLEVGQLGQAELFCDISPAVWTNSSCNWGQRASKVGYLKQLLAKARCSTTDQQKLSSTCNACQLPPKL